MDMTAFNRKQILILVLLLYLTFISGTAYAELNLSLHVINQLLLTGLFSVWLILKIRRQEPFPSTPIDKPLSAWLAVMGLGAFFGLSPRISLEKFWMPLVHVLFFYFLIDMRRKGLTRLFLRGLYMSAAVICLVGIVEFSSWYFGWPLLSTFNQGWAAIGGLAQPMPPTLYRLGFTLEVATNLSAYLALLIPPALIILAGSRDKDDKQAALVWLVLAVVVEILSFSRGGLLALAVSLPLTLAGYWLIKRPDVKRLRLNGKRLALIITLVALALFITSPMLIALARQTFTRGESNEFRLTLWGHVFSTFLQHPLTGIGEGNFGRSILLLNDAAYPRRQIPTAHNIYFNSAVELGVAGILAGLWLLISLARGWYERWRREQDMGQKIGLVVCGASLAGFAAHSLVETFVATSIWLPVLCLTAFILQAEPAEITEATIKDEDSRVDRRIPAFLLALVLIYFCGLALTDVARYHLQRSVEYADRQQAQTAISEARQAIKIDPALPLNTLQLAYLLGKQTDTASLNEAEENYRHALAMEPVYGRQAANLAAVLWRLDKRAEAIQWLEKAVSAESSSIYFFNLGRWYEQMGDAAHAAQAYSRALLLAPAMAGSAYWQQTDSGRQMLQAALEEADTELADGPAAKRLAWRMAVSTARGDWSGEGKAANELIRLNPHACNALTAKAEVELEAGDKESAGKALDTALSADRACAGGYLLRGVLAEMEGRDAEAQKAWQTALFLGDSRAGYYLGRAYESEGKDEQALKAYVMAFPLIIIANDAEVILYSQRLTFDILPPLERIGVERTAYRAVLAAAGILEKRKNFSDARRVYKNLLLQDPYLPGVKQRLAALGDASE